MKFYKLIPQAVIEEVYGLVDPEPYYVGEDRRADILKTAGFEGIEDDVCYFERWAVGEDDIWVAFTEQYFVRPPTPAEDRACREYIVPLGEIRHKLGHE